MQAAAPAIPVQIARTSATTMLRSGAMKVSELKADLDALSREMKTRFEVVEQRFLAVDRRFDVMDARVDAFRQEIREEIAREGATTRAHFDVVAEGIKADVAQFMTRVATLDDRVAVVRSEHATYRSLLDNHEIRLNALERHQG
jgi:hypothetical protein